MSKKLIAGAGVVASLAVALAPLATFATDTESDQHTDRLNITVMPACSFGSVNLATADPGVTHSTGTAVTNADAGSPAVGSWETTDSNGTGRLPDSASGTNNNKSDDTFTYSIFAGTKKDDLASTTLKVFCNDNGGYMIKAVTNALTEVTESQTKATIDAQQYSTSTSGYGIVGISSTPMTVAQAGETPATVSASNVFVSATAKTIAYKTTPSDAAGDSVTMTYGLGVAPGQKAATYEGTVVYTLIHAYVAE